MIARQFICIMTAVIFAGCQGHDTTVPRPLAYPRLPLPDARYEVPDGIPLILEYNVAAACAVVDSTDRGARWLTIEYPGIDAAIYITFTPVSDAVQTLEVSANRYERLSRDLGGDLDRIAGIAPAGEYTVYMTEAQVPTPGGAILIASDSIRQNWVISAAIRLSGDSYLTNPDSLAPARQYVLNDLIHGFSNARI